MVLLPTPPGPETTMINELMIEQLARQLLSAAPG
jgi:hypothetical protein